MRQTVRGVTTVILLLMGMSLSAQTPNDTIQGPPVAPLVDYDHPKQYIINNVRVTGVHYLDPEILAKSMGINQGDTIMLPSDYISSSIRKIWNLRYFSDIQIVAEPVGDSVNFEVYLRERPRVYRWNYTGIKKGAQTELKDKLKLKPGSELSDYLIHNTVDIIEKYYKEKGFLNVQVGVRQENDTTVKNRNAVNVTFDVERGPRVKIGKIIFDGNEQFTDKRLRRTFKKTHQKSINIFKGSKFKKDEYANDKENLIDYYNSKGYRNAIIIKDTTYSISEKRIALHLTLDEGRKFYLRNVSWMGNSVYTTEHLNAILSVVKGQVYDRKTVNKRLGVDRESSPDDISVSSLYQNSGYIMSNVEPGEIVVAEDTVDLQIKIYEGKQARINDVNISGNLRVNENVIRRELYVRPGELYDRSLLMQTLRQLNQMQHFNPENLAPGIQPVTNELVDISFPLTEQASDKFDVSGGWGAGMFVGSVGVQFNNFAIQDMFKKNTWRPYPSGRSQQLAIRGQTNGRYYKALSMNFTEPWLGGKKPNSLSVGLYYSHESNANSFFSRADKHFRTLGTSVGVGRRLSWPDRYFTLYNEVGYQAYMLKDWDNFLVKNGTSNIITFRTIFGRNSVDQPVFPRQGSDFSATMTLTPPYSLFNGVDYSDPTLSDRERYRFIEFHKWVFRGDWYYSLTKNQKLVLMFGAQMGFLGAYNQHKQSPFEGFDVGGDGMSGFNVYGVDIVRMRGYRNGALTPYSPQAGNYARAYNKYTVEIRYPFMLQPSSTIFGLIFAEGGNAFSTWQDFDPFAIKRAIGIGVRLQLPMVGLIGFDWGYGFDTPARDDKRSGGQFHFMMGQQF